MRKAKKERVEKRKRKRKGKNIINDVHGFWSQEGVLCSGVTLYVTWWITHSGWGRASTLAKRAHQYMTKHRLRRTLLIWPLLHLWFIFVWLIFCHIHFVCCITGLSKIPEVYFFGKSDSVLNVLLMKINHKAEHKYKIRGGVLKFILSLTVGMCVGGKKY